MARDPLKTKRIYEPPADDDGLRVLVDRLWPRGLSKESAHVDLWLRDLAPSSALRKAFHGKPETWDQFRKAYGEELTAPAAQAAFVELRTRRAQGPITLLYAARDEAHNNAEALRLWLEANGV
jgi:uncharacterized protein YeaO (DUF488 family)